MMHHNLCQPIFLAIVTLGLWAGSFRNEKSEAGLGQVESLHDGRSHERGLLAKVAADVSGNSKDTNNAFACLFMN